MEVFVVMHYALDLEFIIAKQLLLEQWLLILCYDVLKDHVLKTHNINHVYQTMHTYIACLYMVM